MSETLRIIAEHQDHVDAGSTEIFPKITLTLEVGKRGVPLKRKKYRGMYAGWKVTLHDDGEFEPDEEIDGIFCLRTNLLDREIRPGEVFAVFQSPDDQPTVEDEIIYRIIRIDPL